MRVDKLSLIRSGFCSDFEINVKGKLIQAHKHILAAKSEYFKLLFSQSNVIETTTNMLTINGHQYEIVDSLISFCYTKVLNLTGENIDETLSCAHAYDLEDALYHCSYYIDKNRDIRYLEFVSALMPCLALDWIYFELVDTYSMQNCTTLDISVASYELLRDMATRELVSCNMMSDTIAEWYRIDPVNRYDLADCLFHHLCFDDEHRWRLLKIIESELAGEFEGLRRSIDRAYLYKAFSNNDGYEDSEDSSYHMYPGKPSLKELMDMSYEKAPQYTIDLPDFVPDSKYTDFTISIDGKSIKTHKIVLIANSEYFADLLRDAEGKCESLTIRNHRFGIVESLVNLCYTEELPLNESNIEQTLLCAHEFKFKEALNRCAQYITFKPSVSLFIYISRMKECPTLGRCYYDLIRYYSENFGKIKDQNGILEKLSYDLLRDLTQSRYASSISRKKLLDTVIEWFRSDPKIRLSEFKSLMHQKNIHPIIHDDPWNSSCSDSSDDSQMVVAQPDSLYRAMVFAYYEVMGYV